MEIQQSLGHSLRHDKLIFWIESWIIFLLFKLFYFYDVSHKFIWIDYKHTLMDCTRFKRYANIHICYYIDVMD